MGFLGFNEQHDAEKSGTLFNQPSLLQITSSGVINTCASPILQWLVARQAACLSFSSHQQCEPLKTCSQPCNCQDWVCERLDGRQGDECKWDTCYSSITCIWRNLCQFIPEWIPFSYICSVFWDFSQAARYFGWFHFSLLQASSVWSYARYQHGPSDRT